MTNEVLFVISVFTKNLRKKRYVILLIIMLKHIFKSSLVQRYNLTNEVIKSISVKSI